MPIYEFFCTPCNTIFSFYSSRINTSKIPDCPKCNNKLKRQMSTFATVGRAREDDDNPFPGLDENKMESVLGELAREAEKVNEDDPRQMARIMRRFSEKTGLELGGSMEEALARLERGENPDEIEQEMGELLEGEDPVSFLQKKGKFPRKKKPRRDETLYEL
jgi:putative FmdB family regulatory protein